MAMTCCDGGEDGDIVEDGEVCPDDDDGEAVAGDERAGLSSKSGRCRVKYFSDACNTLAAMTEASEASRSVSSVLRPSRT